MLTNFLIKVPYSTVPNMSKHEGDAFQYPPDPIMLLNKRIELERFGSDLYATTHEATVNQLIRKASRYCNVKETTDIVELALNFQEDFAIMHKGALAAICFCFPSGFVPSSKIGLQLMQIHSAVPDSDKLVSVSQRIAEMMASITSGPFRRYVWSVCNNKEYSQHPENKSTTPITSLKDLYFRTEVQTTVPLGDNVSSLFFVKPDMHPMEELWGTDLGNTIVASINSMSDAILDYKNLRQIKNYLNSQT